MIRFDVIHVALRAWLIAVLVFMLAPLIFVVINSFNSSPFSRFPPEAFSLRWYQDALTYAPFQAGFRNSVFVALGATSIALVSGILAAIALVRYSFRGRDVLRTAFIAPMVVPKVALGLAAFILFLRLADTFGLREQLFGTPISLVLVHALIGLPLVVVIISSTLVALDPTLEEAAADLGAGPRETLLRVTLPLIRQGAIIAGVFAFMFSFDEVESAIFLSPIAGRTLPVEMFLFLERRQDPTLAAVSSLLVAATFIGVVILASRFGIERVTRVSARQ